MSHDRIPEELIEPILNVLKEVVPRHIDEVAFYGREKRALILVWPAVELYQDYVGDDKLRETLKISRFLIRRDFKPSEIRRMKALSEEVKIDREIELRE